MQTLRQGRARPLRPQRAAAGRQVGDAHHPRIACDLRLAARARRGEVRIYSHLVRRRPPRIGRSKRWPRSRQRLGRAAAVRPDQRPRGRASIHARRRTTRFTRASSRRALTSTSTTRRLGPRAHGSTKAVAICCPRTRPAAGAAARASRPPPRRRGATVRARVRRREGRRRVRRPPAPRRPRRHGALIAAGSPRRSATRSARLSRSCADGTSSPPQPVADAEARATRTTMLMKAGRPRHRPATRERSRTSSLADGV